MQATEEAVSLARIVQWFKTMTTNDYFRGVKTRGWPRVRGRLWQENYWEHIIRGEQELHACRDYIRENPRLWAGDLENPGE